MTDFSANVVIDGNNIVLSLTDGGPGDADGVVNGIIIDPSGPAVPPTSGASSGDSGGGGGGGCFITNVAYGFRKAETFSALTLLLGFGIICILRSRRKLDK